ncbi:MAG TPA: class I SAM-dependent methyltransferase [Chloroflexia bacterium]|nr:class I SAM-dependent methyltransferase [Chloroflexia bacterium]
MGTDRDLNSETQAIWNESAAFWDERMGEEGNYWQRTLVGPATDRLLQVQPGEVVLDIACGNGVSSRRLAQQGAKVVAFDFSEQFIGLARARDASSANPVDYRVIDATDEAQLMALGAGRFDAAISNMALMDIANIEPLLSATSKLLKPGGRFVFSQAHPCFNIRGVKMVAEEEDVEGELGVSYALKVSKYKEVQPGKVLGMVGQPSAQYWFQRTLSDLFNACFRAGFLLDGIEEPSFGDETPMKDVFSWANLKGIPPVLVGRMRLR